MSDQSAKPPGRGRGQWQVKGEQASQRADIEELKSLVAEMAARLDALEGGDDTGTDGGTEPTDGTGTMDDGDTTSGAGADA